MHLPRLLTVPLLVVLLVGCTDQALVDRVAQLEQADERLRSSLTELGAPDPAAQEDREALLAELEAVSGRITAVEAELEAVAASIDAQGLEVDDRITTLELQLGEATSDLVALEAALTTLTDRVSSLEAQFDAHRTDPSGHAG